MRLAELVQSQVAEAGFALKVVPLENNTAFKNQTDGKYEIQLTPWSGRVDPDGNINRFHHSTGSDNTSKASDPAIDALLDKARAEADVTARKALYKQIVEQVRARRNVVVFQWQNLYAAYAASLHGFGDVCERHAPLEVRLPVRGAFAHGRRWTHGPVPLTGHRVAARLRACSPGCGPCRRPAIVGEGVTQP